MRSNPTIYIPTLTAGAKLSRCLAAIEEHWDRPEVVVADNGDGGACKTLIEQGFPWVKRIGFGRNLGFGPALNRAIASHGDGPIVVLNDDAVIRPGFIEALLAERDGRSSVAAVLTSEERPGFIDSAGVIIDQTLMAFDYLSTLPLQAAASAPAPLGPTGGAALYERQTFNAVGGFDERIFLYYEDVDLNLRLRRHGAGCRLAHEAVAVHGYSQTLGSNSGAKYGRTGWSRGYLLRKYGLPRGVRNTLGLIAREAVICGGQIVLQRSFSGLIGRLKGWRDARDTAGVEIVPFDAVQQMSARTALVLRKRRFSHT